MAKYGEHSSAWELGQTGGAGQPRLGLLAAGEGEGSQGAATRTVREKSGTPIPSAGSGAHARLTF